MIKVSIIGSGNVAQHLIAAFSAASEIDLVQVYARQPAAVNHLVTSEKITSDLSDLKDSDIFIISVSDTAVGEISAKISIKNRLVVHTAGSLSFDILDSKNRRGVFYPLQTFSRNKPLEFNKIPVCIEAEDISDLNLLGRVAKSISDHVHLVGERQRLALHVSAVFVNNFTNHMYGIGERLCAHHEVPFEILKPLIRETAEKVMVLSPEKAQTGPAIRNDENTIWRHMEFLNGNQYSDIYTTITKSIQNGDKL